ncbi:hypothetical protein [Paenibacillus chitinolyticus]|uniref:hypothetical protein n=1 Tax=Paenibacillus chitinolyticus TaxID=79263 RepID=UPI00366BCA52
MNKKNEGKVFEQNYEESVKKTEYFFLRLKDTAKWLRGSNSSFTPKNPCDGIQFTSPFLWLIELKSTKNTSISFNLNRNSENKGRMIKAHQIDALSKFALKDSLIPGFIFNFRAKRSKKKIYFDDTYFVHIKDFMEWSKSTKRSSISRTECELIGIKIDSQLKKVHHTYDIERFVKEAIQNYVQKEYISLKKIKNYIVYLEGLIG